MSISVTLNNVGSLADTTTAATTINNNNATLTTALSKALSTAGEVSNQMNTPLDMNSNQIVNLPAPATSTSPLRLQDLNSFVGGGTISNIPSGGTTGQVLGKTSNTSYQVGWTNSVTSVGLALPADFTVTNSPVTTTGNLTGAWAVAPTGTGSIVKATSPVLTTPNLGAATATSINKVAVTAPATGSTLTIADGKTLTASNSLTLAGTDATTFTFPTTSGTVDTTSATATLTNKTIDTAGPNTIRIAGTALTAVTGTGSVVLANKPAITGTATNDDALAGNIGEYKYGGTLLGGVASTTVTITVASPAVVTWTAHGFLDYSPVYFTTTGTLPTGLSPSVGYYVVPGSQTANTFQIAATIGGAAINTTGAGTGTHTGFNAFPTSNAGTTQNVTALSLTAGDWDVTAMGLTSGGSTTNISYVLFSLSTTSATLDVTNGREVIYPAISTPFSGGGAIALPIPSARFSLASPTLIYMVVNSVFSVSTMSTYGCLHARRIR